MQLHDYDFIRAFASRYELFAMPRRSSDDPHPGLIVFKVAEHLYVKISKIVPTNGFFVEFSQIPKPRDFEESSAWLACDSDGKIVGRPGCFGGDSLVEDSGNLWWKDIAMSTYWPFDVEG
jgi:hypothetical protein